ncbi:peptidase C69, partial [Neisseria gonorrhoeae SK6987]
MLFNHTASELLDLCRRTLDLAKAAGATAAEADFSESLGQSVSVRLGEIEQIEFQQDKSLDITVYVGKRKGRAGTADFSEQALRDTVRAAADIARHTAEDGCAGLADPELMAQHIGDPDLYHEWDLDTEAAVGLAKQCEQAALDTDSRIENSEGAAVQTGHYQYVYGNTHGFAAHRQSTHHSISCSVVAADENGMQRDYWYDSACRHPDMDSPETIGQTAARRTLRRLGSRSIPTG